MKSLRQRFFFWRSQLMVCIGVLIATAVCIGSLALGDSARHSLQQTAILRLGQIQDAVIMQGRFVNQDLAQRLASEREIDVASVLSLRGLLSSPHSQKRHPRILVHGVSDSFWNLAPQASAPIISGLAINQALADYLDVKVGQDLILRIEKPSLLSRDAPLTPDDAALESLRLPLAAVITDDAFGQFQLSASSEPSMNVFLPLAMLQEGVELEGWINQMFSAQITTSQLENAIKETWSLTDIGIDLHQINEFQELRSERIFIDNFIDGALQQVIDTLNETAGNTHAVQGSAVLGYMVNRFSTATHTTPYSIVAALDQTSIDSFALDLADPLHGNQVIVNQWLAEDLQVQVGDQIEVSYFELQSNNEMLEKQQALIVTAIVPIEGLAADRHLMPAFPGLADKDDCREWDPGAHVELAAIRDKDEAYWDTYRGTPKAFVSLELGRKLWSNRFGNATAYRLNGIPRNFMLQLRQYLSPEQFGLTVTPIAAMIEQAGKGGAQYISSVFVSLSMFLIIAALILVALFYDISIHQRRKEMGLLMALGFTPQQVIERLLKEHLWFLVLGIGAGIATSYVYFYLVFYALANSWSDAIAQAQLSPQLSLSSVLIGAAAVFLIAITIVYQQLRRYRKEPAQQLLRGTVMAKFILLKSALPIFGIGLAFIAIGVFCLLYLPVSENDPIRFFTAAICALIAGLCLLNALHRSLQTKRQRLGFLRLVLINWAYHGRRHSWLIAMLSSCIFLVIASAAFRLDPEQEGVQRAGGTGGFHYFGQSSLPIERDLHSADGQALYAIDAEQMQGMQTVLMRANNDEETSCLNLNQAQEPRLWGLDWRYLNQTQAFSFVQAASYTQSPWELLEYKPEHEGKKRIPVIGDINSLLWSLGKGLGSVFLYSNENGEVFELEVVGLLQDSMLQGGLLMDERYFSEMFPNISGYQYMLLDVLTGDPASAAQKLEQRFQMHGLVLERSQARLQRYVEVRNTYILIFQAIGALGIALGSVGIAALVLRHVFERRGEFAVMRSYGYTSKFLLKLLFWEHASIVLIALILGSSAALLAMIPISQGLGQLLHAWFPMFLISAVALIATAVACRIAMRGQILDGLRGE